ncbi:Sphingomyelin phosphodiesterase 4 [Orchesella cincta]|uniref:Sphingomyelin phosphodiesterase 4 n=1 Tax=Orchesella cincta TaxID=48709 RepID=A0A1D2NNG3_ORCCI|nr:Sphingomyelin phosphodiesterase 4 [Orchesella cincta]
MDTLHLDPNKMDIYSSEWKELDSKFLSNDSPTNAQKMLQPVTPADRLDHILNHSSLYIRASDLTLFLENVGLFQLKQQFQLIVNAIFGFNTKYPTWSLRSITKGGNPREAAVILKLLGPTGPLVSLATKLLEDPGFIVEVGLDKLPFVLSRRILQGDIPPYFSSRLCVTDPFPQAAMTSPMIKGLRLNTFEFYILSFSGHICAVGGAGNTDYLIGWGMTDNLYHNLLDEYLVYFFPCDGHGVPSDNFRLSYQQVNDSMYIAQSLRSNMMNMDPSGSPNEGDSPRLIKSALILENLPSTRGDAFFRKTQIQKEVWRTETILLICTELWMAHALSGAFNKNASPSATDQKAILDFVLSQFGSVMLPAVDVVKAVRMVVRHLHFFLACITASVMHPMEELKRDVYPAYEKKLYKFIRHLFYNWPLDNSFRIVYETWLSYIQPWRYVLFERIRSTPGAKEAAEAPVDSRWYPFIQENILFYSKLFSIMLSRMSRVEFATTKNALMFYRVAKVFTGHEYLKAMLADIDTILSYEQPYHGQMNGVSSSPLYNSSFGRISGTTTEAGRGTAIFRIASLKQIMKDWEYPEYVYEPLFSETNHKIMCALIDSTKAAKDQLQELIDATLTQQSRDQSWWDKLLGTNKQYNAVVGQSIAELNKAINQLEYGKNQFAHFFDIPIMDSSDAHRTPVFTPTRVPRKTFIGSSLDGSVLEGTENRITVLPSGVFTCDMLVPVGNPDHAAVRSDECDVLVSWMKSLSGFLNQKFAGDIMSVYFQRTWKGRFARATFAQPVEYFDVEKRRGRSREKVRKVLPPRVSLRFLCSLNFLCIFALFFVVCLLFGWTLGIPGVMLLFWGIFVTVRAIAEPDKKLDDLIYLYGDRNYNVDFRGRQDRSEIHEG